MSGIKRFFDPGRDGMARDLGLLVLRLGLGFSLVYAHGYGKFQGMLGGGGANFPDPIGLGGPLSLALAAFAEFICAIAISVGFMTRLASIPVVILFAVAFFVVHGGDPFPDKEKAFLFLVGYLAVLFTGPGRYSLDEKLRRK